MTKFRNYISTGPPSEHLPPRSSPVVWDSFLRSSSTYLSLDNKITYQIPGKEATRGLSLTRVCIMLVSGWKSGIKQWRLNYDPGTVDS